MQRAGTKKLYSYWNEIRGARSAPERRDIDPTKIREALANTFILQSEDGVDFSFRLAGSHLCSAYCRELKGRGFAELWREKDRDAVETMMRAVVEDQAVALLTFIGTGKSGRELGFELALMPLRHNRATNTRMLGAMSAFDTPYWFGTQPVLEQRITGLRLIWPDDVSAPDVGQDIAAAVAEARAAAPLGGMPVRVQGIAARRYQHLSVIDGGRD